MTIEQLKSEAYDLLEQRGQLLMQAQAIEARIGEIKAQIDALKEDKNDEWWTSNVGDDIGSCCNARYCGRDLVQG